MIVECLLFLLLVWVILRLDKKPENLPPGPWGFPIVGAFLSTGIVSNNKIRNYAAKYGNVFSVRMGSQLFVYITDYETAKSTFNKPEFSTKPDLYTFKIFCHGQNVGLVNSDDEVWANGRRFALRQLRDLGFGKTRMQDSIMREAEMLVTHLKKSTGKPVELAMELNLAVLNIIWQLVANKRFDINDNEMLKFMKLVDDLFKLIQGPINLLVLFPWMKDILPNFILNSWGKDKLESARDEFDKYYQKVIQEHVEKLDEDNPKDYIDQYLIAMKKEKDDPKSTFRSDYLDLQVAINDMFIAGSETTSTSLRWAVLLLASHPDIQKKIQNLIDEIVPRDRLPSLEDREKLVYLEAMAYEVLRYSSFIGQSLPHQAKTNSTIAGFNIPKGTIVNICTEHMHYNKAYFNDANKFNPERFIDENGRLDTKKIGFGPFGLGRRQCLGESLAKAELFLFTGAILQHFDIVPPAGVKLDTSFDATKPLFNFAKPHKVVLNARF